MDLSKEKSIKQLIEGNSDFRRISPANRQEGLRQRASFKLTQLLGDRKVNELSLEEALKLKELGDLTVNWKGEYDRTTYALYDHIDSLYEIEAAGEFVKALKLARVRLIEIQGAIEELKLLLTESDQRLYTERAARSRILLGIQFGINRGPDIKRLEEGNIMMLEELNQKLEEKRILEQEISKIQLQIKKLKEEYLSSDLLKQMKQVAHEALRSDLAAAEAARIAESFPGGIRMRKGANSHSLRRRAQKAKNRLQNAAEQKAVRNLNARESERAANLIFPSQNRRNQSRRKPTWGIPNVGPGFGGSRKRRRSRKN